VLILEKPDVRYKARYFEMMDEWKASGEQPEPWPLRVDSSDFEAMVKSFAHFTEGLDLPEGVVPSSTYWAYDDETDKIVGAANIRHCLNDVLLKTWGNVGYGVRPGERRRGYATAILRLALEKCRELAMDRVLLACYEGNAGSIKTIEKNGGVLENQTVDGSTGRTILQYWIQIA
jgi:predicted acetyltransferase